MNPIIVLDNIHKCYPLYHHITGGFRNFLFHMPTAIKQLQNTKFWALQGISFEVNRGETFGVIGRNGAGKSTLLGLIARVMKPTSGVIAINADKIAPLLELGAGFHVDLTGRENIVLNGMLLGMTKKEITSRLNEIIEFSELHEFIDQPLRIYSSGMLARLGFSVAVHIEPDLLLVDEILAVGDIEFQKKCIDRMQEFKKKNVSIVIVSHSMQDVEKMCDRAVWIENHKVKMIGDAKTVVAAYKGAKE